MPAMRKDDDWVQRRVFLFSHPRTASNLFLRMLSAQSEWQISTYHYLEGFQYLREALQDAKDISSLKADAKTQCETLSRRAAEKMQASLDVAASQGKHCLIKEHAFMVSPLLDMKRHEDLRAGLKPTTQSSQQKNPTVFSDQEMFSWQPIILIRNPIAVYESWVKVEGSPYPDLNSAIGQIYTTLTYQRRIFDWYQQSSNNEGKAVLPIVIDADDLIDRPEIIYKLCDSIGMNREELVFQWDAKPRLENPSDRMKRIEHFHSTIWGSTGIDQSKTARHLDLKIKEVEWAAKFGIEQAKVLVERVNRSWPDYEHLKAYKLC